MVVCRVFHPGLMPKATDILLQQDATGQPQQNEWEECMFIYTQDCQPCVRNILNHLQEFLRGSGHLAQF